MPTSYHLVCPSCAAVNRIAAGRDPMQARCGSCKKPLFGGHPADADARMYERQVGRSDIPVLITAASPLSR